MAERKDWFLACSSWKQVKLCCLGVGELQVNNGTGVVPSKDKVVKAVLSFKAASCFILSHLLLSKLLRCNNSQHSLDRKHP